MFALIGFPLGHSMSPFIHKRLFELSGKNEDYELFEINPESLQQGFETAIEKYNGLNVTIPHKTKVIPFLDMLDESAKRYNAVNCVSKKEDKLVGYNTDCIGFLRSVPEDALSKKVLICGCGGAGRMMAIEAAAHGADLTIAIKDFAAQQAETLTEEINQKYPSVSVKITDIDNIEGEFDFLANATPVGMYPNVDACPVSESVIKNCKNVFDAVYNPNKTILVKTAEKFGINAVGGMSMLVLQAVAAHEIWYGASFTKEQIDELISDASEAVMKMF